MTSKAKKYMEVCNAVYRLVELEMVHVDDADILLMALSDSGDAYGVLKDGVTLEITSKKSNN